MAGGFLTLAGFGGSFGEVGLGGRWGVGLPEDWLPLECVVGLEVGLSDSSDSLRAGSGDFFCLGGFFGLGIAYKI